VDSIKANYGQVLLVDGGGFFPDNQMHLDVSWFLMDVMRLLDIDAVGMGDRELRFGVGYLKAQIARTQLPMVCANLYEQETGELLLPPYVIKRVGRVKVGIFGLMNASVDLGPSRDSLRVEEPAVAAKRAVEEMRKKGATVVVLLSQLGKIDGEDLVASMDGIDAVVLGRSVPLLLKGRMINNTVACYGGEQGQYIGRTILTLDKRGHVTTGENEAFMLGPSIPDKKEIAELTKGFEESFNAKLRRLEKERAAKAAEQAVSGSREHYLGGEVCARCHPAEAAQWQTTGHAKAWQTLVESQKDASPECVGCHVVGNGQPGGFRDMITTPKMANVQCESCHGMGTQHDAFSTTPRRVTEQTCRICHTPQASPQFDFALFEPYTNHKGEGEKRPLPPSPMKQHLTAGK
jgi:hypothetical protein